jgi:2-iminobutanoate/2-iminopropanoate deaminase
MKKTYISSSETGLPFSEAIEVNGHVFISGQVHSNESGDLVGEGIEEKTHQSMKNIKTILDMAGLTFDDVVKMEILLPNLSERTLVSKVYESYFAHPLPTRVMCGVKELPMGADIEIVATAIRSN